MTPTCTKCGERRPDGVAHDSERCGVIAKAYAACDCRNALTGGAPSEAHQHIVQLSLWLRNHPAADATPARERSLNFWIEIAQEGEVS
jgi:hypothetical protein